MSLFRPRLRIPRIGAVSRLYAPQRQQRRFEHAVPMLPTSLQNCMQDGIGLAPPETSDFEAAEAHQQFLSATAVDIAWSQYMTLAIDKLNRLTAGTELDGMSLPNIIFNTARNPDKAPTFNYASMAHNTHFFFGTLSHYETVIPDTLRESIIKSFGSVDVLKQQFILTAMAMFGPGFVWLVKTRTAGTYNQYNLRLLPTYLAGSPYPKAHYRQQPIDMNTVPSSQRSQARDVGGWLDKLQTATGYTKPPYISESAAALAAGNIGAALSSPGAAPTQPVEEFPPTAGPKKTVGVAPPNASLEVIPILCLNTWEHVWLCDYGVLTPDGRESKRVYAETWWKHIDWAKVEANAEKTTPAPQGVPR